MEYIHLLWINIHFYIFKTHFLQCFLINIHLNVSISPTSFINQFHSISLIEFLCTIIVTFHIEIDHTRCIWKQCNEIKKLIMDSGCTSVRSRGNNLVEVTIWLFWLGIISDLDWFLMNLKNDYYTICKDTSSFLNLPCNVTHSYMR